MIIKNNIIAHRGMFNNKDIPENSKKAFEEAIKNDIAFECDIQLTKDNILVIFHDDTLKRMTGISKKISDITYKELSANKILNTKYTIPTLKEILELNNDKVLIDIEIKPCKNYKKACEILIKELKNYNNYILKSFHPFIVHYLKKKTNNIEVGYLISKKYPKKIQNIFLPSRLLIWYIHPDFLAINKQLINKKKYKQYLKKIPILLWTIKEQKKYPKNCILICNNLKK